MYEDYGVKTYQALYKVINLGFAENLKDSGLKLEDLFAIKNLVSKEQHYVLLVNGSRVKFYEAYDFILGFSDFLELSVSELTREYDELIKQQLDEFDDELGHERRYKEVWYQAFQQQELLKKLKYFQNQMDTR